MMDIENSSFLKQEFLATLKKTDKTKACINVLLEQFCDVVWLLDDMQLECFEKLKDFMSSLPLYLKKVFIPKLIDMSICYPRLVLLAGELFDSLDDLQQKSVKIPMIYWTFDRKYTLISTGEYQYLKTHGKSIWGIDGRYRRPMQNLDVICYGKVLEMIAKSQASSVVITSEGRD